MEPIEIVIDDLVLRPWRPDDAGAVYRACQVPYRRRDAEAFIATAPGAWLRGDGAIFAITSAGSDAVTGAGSDAVTGDCSYAGVIDLRIRPDGRCPDTAEVGFNVAPWARGRGLAPAAVRTLCGWGFDELGLHHVTWRAHVGNDASRRVAEKAGFAFEGVQRGGCAHRGERRDAWVSARLATDPRLGTQ